MNWEKIGLEARSGFSEQVRKQNHDSYRYAQVQLPQDDGTLTWRVPCQELNEAAAKSNLTQKTPSTSNSRWQGIHGKPVWRSMWNFIFQRTKPSVYRPSCSSQFTLPECKALCGGTFPILVAVTPTTLLLNSDGTELSFLLLLLPPQYLENNRWEHFRNAQRNTKMRIPQKYLQHKQHLKVQAMENSRNVYPTLDPLKMTLSLLIISYRMSL